MASKSAQRREQRKAMAGKTLTSEMCYRDLYFVNFLCGQQQEGAGQADGRMILSIEDALNLPEVTGKDLLLDDTAGEFSLNSNQAVWIVDRTKKLFEGNKVPRWALRSAFWILDDWQQLMEQASEEREAPSE